MPKIIIGLAGEMASGKSTVTEYLKQRYHAETFRFSDMLRDILKRIHQEPTRHNLQTLSTLLRQQFNEDIMSRVLAADVESSTASFIITEGIRRPSDILYLKDIPGFYLIAIDADERVRYERIIARRENPDDASKTWEQFKHEGEQEAELKIREVMETASFRINNNGAPEELYTQIDAIIQPLLSP